MTENDFWTFEEKFWRGDTSFYKIYLAPTATMVFPPPAGILERSAILASLQSAGRWSSVDILDKHLSYPNPFVAVLVYSVTATRSNAEKSYTALCSSTYAKTGDKWQLAAHQQTPQ